MHFVYLMLGIGCEIVAVSFLKASDEFNRLIPSMIVVAGYAAALYFLTLSLRGFPVGIAYALWSGLGIITVSIVGYAVYGQKLDLPAFLGIVLILTGTIIINIFSTAIKQ
jgi:small multidrug resistance pump